MAENEIKDPWYEKPCIQRMVEESNGQTVFDDRNDPNRARDPYAPSRDFTYYMKWVVQDIWDDMLGRGYSPSITAMVDKLDVSNNRLKETYNSFIDMVNGFVGGSKSHIGQTLDEVAEQYGYKQLEPEAKTLFEAMIGRYFIASFFFAAKCLTPVGGRPLGDIGYNGTFDFFSQEVKQNLDGVETDYARKVKEKNENREVDKEVTRANK